jgi:hypothetical protein
MMERLTPVRKELLDHASAAAKLLETAGKALEAHRRKLLTLEESRELFENVVRGAGEELTKAIRLIANAIPAKSPAKRTRTRKS